MGGGITFTYVRCVDKTLHHIIKTTGLMINNEGRDPFLVISPSADDAEGSDWLCQFPTETLAERIESKLNIVEVQPGPIAR